MVPRLQDLSESTICRGCRACYRPVYLLYLKFSLGSKVGGYLNMNHKHLRISAILIFIVFGVTIVVYPLIFGTDPNAKSEPPVQLELHR